MSQMDQYPTRRVLRFCNRYRDLSLELCDEANDVYYCVEWMVGFLESDDGDCYCGLLLGEEERLSCGRFVHGEQLECLLGNRWLQLERLRGVDDGHLAGFARLCEISARYYCGQRMGSHLPDDLLLWLFRGFGSILGSAYSFPATETNWTFAVRAAGTCKHAGRWWKNTV